MPLHRWGYRDNLLALTKAKFKKELKPAPRFDLSRFTSKYVAGHGVITFYFMFYYGPRLDVDDISIL